MLEIMIPVTVWASIRQTNRQ